MKNSKTKISLIIIAFMAIVLVSCENFGLKGFRGAGAIVSETKEISLIEGLKLEIPATVHLTKGDKQSLRIDAQQNIIDNIETHVNNEVLTLKFDEYVAWHKDIHFYLRDEGFKDKKDRTFNISPEQVFQKFKEFFKL